MCLVLAIGRVFGDTRSGMYSCCVVALLSRVFAVSEAFSEQASNQEVS